MNLYSFISHQVLPSLAQYFLNVILAVVVSVVTPLFIG